MEVLEATKAIRSVSRFKPTPVPEQKVQAVMNAARLSMSVDNLQPWKFIVVTDEDLKKKLVNVCGNAKLNSSAPLLIVACARMDEAVSTVGGYMNSYPLDLGMAISHLTLAAINEGLGTSWAFSFNEEKVKAVLGIPPDAKVIGLTPLGFPEELPPPDGRKHLSEILSYNKY